MLQTPYHEAAEQMLDSLLEQCCSVKTEVTSLQETNIIATQGWFSVIHNNFQVIKHILGLRCAENLRLKCLLYQSNINTESVMGLCFVLIQKYFVNTAHCY